MCWARGVFSVVSHNSQVSFRGNAVFLLSQLKCLENFSIYSVYHFSQQQVQRNAPDSINTLETLYNSHSRTEFSGHCREAVVIRMFTFKAFEWTKGPSPSKIRHFENGANRLWNVAFVSKNRNKLSNNFHRIRYQNIKLWQVNLRYYVRNNCVKNLSNVPRLKSVYMLSCIDLSKDIVRRNFPRTITGFTPDQEMHKKIKTRMHAL